MDAEPRGPLKKLREFEDENGDKLLSLNPDLEGTLVGTTVSSGGRPVKVVKEITNTLIAPAAKGKGTFIVP